jgi:hypothetical protein
MDTTECTASRRAGSGTNYDDATAGCCHARIGSQLPFRYMTNCAKNREVTLVGASLNNSHSFVCSNLATKASLSEEVTFFERIAFLARLLLKQRYGYCCKAFFHTQVGYQVFRWSRCQNKGDVDHSKLGRASLETNPFELSNVAAHHICTKGWDVGRGQQ